MARDLTYQPVSHNHEEFLNRAGKRAGFKKAYGALDDEYALVRKLLLIKIKT